MTVRVVLARNVRELRLRAGYSQSLLANMAGLNRGHLSELETMKGNPSVDTLVSLADCFDVPITRLFKGVDDAPPYKLAAKSKTDADAGTRVSVEYDRKASERSVRRSDA